MQMEDFSHANVSHFAIAEYLCATCMHLMS